MNQASQPLVSVVMPAHNAANTIAASIDSVLNQSYPQIELIVIDDESSDETRNIVARYNSRLKLITQKKSGAPAARNRGVHEASGEWIAFLDADDLWTENKIQRQLELCGNDSWSHTDYIFFGNNQNDQVRCSDVSPKFGGDVLEYLLVENFLGTSTIMIRKSVFINSGGFDETLQSIQDWDLWLRVAQFHPLGYAAEVLGQYRIHNQSISRSARKTLPNHLRVIERAFSNNGPGRELQHLKSKALASSYGVCSIIASERSDASFAAWCAFNALLQQPTALWRWKALIRILIVDLPKRILRKH